MGTFERKGTNRWIYRDVDGDALWVETLHNGGLLLKTRSDGMPSVAVLVPPEDVAQILEWLTKKPCESCHGDGWQPTNEA